jgi:hypothetical protein
MTKYNLIRVMTFISILVLFFAQSVYDASVHAKMQSIDDEGLSEINAKALDIDFTNFTVRAVVGNDNAFQLKDPANSYDSINIDKLEIGNGTYNITTGIMGPANISSTMSWDLGTKTGPIQTWILGTNILFPVSGTGMAAVASNLYLGVNGTASTLGTRLPIANRVILGNVVFGRATTGTNPDLTPTWYDPPGTTPAFTAPWMVISSEGTVGGRGLEFYGEIAAYIEQLRLDWTGSLTDANAMRAQGIYIYGLMNDVIYTGQDPAGGVGGEPPAWTTRTGSMQIGGDYATFQVSDGTPTGSSVQTYASIDVGSPSATTTSSRVRINAPFAGSIRVREFYMGNQNFGPFALEDLVFYRNEIIFKDLNKL